MSFGLPVITLDNCGPREFIDTNYGFVIKKQSYDNTVTDIEKANKILDKKPSLLKIKE